ncbi:hypothetical protein FV233_11905 [Methylobacterium sp. WL7]|nr:hypothetical protein FV233_11905 [Methylobacterium sp. WL7]
MGTPRRRTTRARHPRIRPPPTRPIRPDPCRRTRLIPVRCSGTRRTIGSMTAPSRPTRTRCWTRPWR